MWAAGQELEEEAIARASGKKPKVRVYNLKALKKRQQRRKQQQSGQA